MQKPWYTVEVSTDQCGFDIRLNDCPIGRHFNKATSFNRPANEWIINGSNTLTVDLFQLEADAGLSPEAEVSISLKVREENDDQFETLAEIVVVNGQLKEGSDGVVEEQNKNSQGRYRIDTELDVALGPWKWQASKVSPSNQETLDSLKAELQSLYALVEDKNLDALVKQSEERIAEHAEAYYMTKQEREDGMRATLKEVLETPGYTLQPFFDGRMRLNRWADGRLFSLTSIFDHSVIRTSSEDGSMLGEIPFIFRKGNDDQWIVTR